MDKELKRNSQLERKVIMIQKMFQRRRKRNTGLTLSYQSLAQSQRLSFMEALKVKKRTNLLEKPMKQSQRKKLMIYK